MSFAEDRSTIETERLHSVFQHAPLTLAVSVLNSILTAWVLAPFAGWALPTAWAGAIAAVSLIRWIGGRAFLRRGRKHEHLSRWTAFSITGSMLTGILWGTGAAVLFPASEPLQLFLALVIGGMCAGAIAVNAAHFASVVAFILPAALPLAGRFLAEGPARRDVALMIVIFAVSLSLISVRAHLAFGARALLQLALGREQRKLSDLNDRLSQEITQRQTVEATLHQAQKMEAIGHLTGGIAHDFNNLLQVMIGNMNLIRRAAEGNELITRYAEAAEQAAIRGAELTGSLLIFARRQALVPERVDVNQLLRDFEPILRRTLAANIRFEIVLDPDLPFCLADPAHFQSAVLNLVINARDATPGGGTVSVSTASAILGPDDLAANPDAKPGRFVSVTVQDNGLGMTPEVMARVFEPFFTTKEVGKGTGLGLSQVYGFAHQSGGHIRLMSQPDKGTSATLWLPAVETENRISDAATSSDNS